MAGAGGRAVRLLNLRRLRRQPLRAMLSVLSVGAGVALAISIVVLVTSLDRSVEEFGRSLGGPADLRVIGATTRGGLDEQVLAKVEATPGVGQAIPMVQAVTVADDGTGRDAKERFVLGLGVDCRIEAVIGRFGCDPTAVAQAGSVPPVVSRALVRRLGRGGALRTDIGSFRLGDLLAVDRLDEFNGGDVAVLSIASAQRQFARAGRLDVIYVDAAPGTNIAALDRRLEAVVGEHNGVLGARDAPPQTGLILQVFVPLFSILAVFALGIGGVLVFNTVTLSLEERRRQLAIVAALGGSRRLVVGGTLLEAAIIGLAGGVLGALGGLALSVPIMANLSEYTERVAGIPVEVHTTAVAAVSAVVAGVMVAMAATVVPVRRALRMDISAELSNREARAEAAPRLRVRRGTIAVLALAAGAVATAVGARDGALEPWQPPLAQFGFLVAVLASIVATSAWAALVVAGVLRLRPARSAAVRLGMANLVREPGRTGVMAAAVSAAVVTAFVTASFATSAEHDITRDVVANSEDRVRVSTLEPNNAFNIDAKLTPGMLERLGRLPEVADVERSAIMLVGTETSELVGIVAYAHPWLADKVFDGSKDRVEFDEGKVLIGAAIARGKDLRAGDTLHLPTPTGMAEVPILGVWGDGSFNGNAVSMPLGLLESLYGPQPSDDALVRPAPGVSADELASAIRAAAIDPRLEVQNPSEFAAVIVDDVRGQMAPFWAIQRSLLFVSFIAVLSTLLLVGIQRRRELGLLAAVGMGPGQLSRMVLAEAAMVGVVGSLLGAVSGLVTFETLRQMAPLLLGFHQSFRVDVTGYFVAAVTGVVVVVAAAAVPAWRTARVQVLEALQYE